MLSVSEASVGYENGPLFQNANFTLNRGDRVGIVGPNGAGKSTLLRMMQGELRPENGSVVTDASIGYLAQTPDFEKPVAEYLDEMSTGLLSTAANLDELYTQLGDPEQAEKAGEILHDFEVRGGWDIESKMAEILSKLGAPKDALSKTFGEFSGGQQSRILLAGQLIQEPDVLLLDEPTNNLDREGLGWIETYLSSYKGAVAVVSHDRAFLDNTATKIIEIDGSGSEPEYYEGGYTDYREEKLKRLAKLALTLEAQQKQQSQLEAAAKKSRERSEKLNGSSKNAFYRSKASKMDRSRLALEGRLARMQKSNKWKHEKEERGNLPLGLKGESRKGRLLIAATAVRLGYGLDVPSVIEDATFTVHGQERVAITGNNGSGKTTLLRALAGRKDTLQAGSIDVFTDFNILAQTDTQEAVKTSDKKVLEWFRNSIGEIYEDEAASLLVWFGFSSEQLRQPVKNLSPGEVSKLALLGMTFSGKELLMLDEPTNHLDFDALDAVEDALTEFKGTLVTVSHDRKFLGNIACNRMLEVKNAKVASVDL